MSKWIDADALIAELQKDEERFDKEADDCRKNSQNYTDCYIQAMSSRADGIRDAIVEVYDAPSIDIEPKRGEWEEKEVFHNGDEPIIEEWQSARCSACNKYHTTPYMYYFDNYNFCPNCGADMRKESE